MGICKSDRIMIVIDWSWYLTYGVIWNIEKIWEWESDHKKEIGSRSDQYCDADRPSGASHSVLWCGAASPSERSEPSWFSSAARPRPALKDLVRNPGLLIFLWTYMKLYIWKESFLESNKWDDQMLFVNNIHCYKYNQKIYIICSCVK